MKLGIDIKTGSDIIGDPKRIFRIDTKNPEESIVYQRICGLLGIGVFERSDPHISSKIATIYNRISASIKSNDPEMVLNAVDGYRRDTGVTFLGKELVKHLYGKLRLEEDRLEEHRKEGERVEKAKNEYDSFKQDSKSAKDLRRSGGVVSREYTKEMEGIAEETQQDLKRYKSENIYKDPVGVTVRKREEHLIERYI